MKRIFGGPIPFPISRFLPNHDGFLPNHDGLACKLLWNMLVEAIFPRLHDSGKEKNIKSTLRNPTQECIN